MALWLGLLGDGFRHVGEVALHLTLRVFRGLGLLGFRVEGYPKGILGLGLAVPYTSMSILAQNLYYLQKSPYLVSG